MNPLKAIWFTNATGNIGIVMAEDGYGELGFYIGAGQGMHEVIDINNIANLGSRFPQEIGNQLFGIKNEPARTTDGIPAVAKKSRASKGVPNMES